MMVANKNIDCSFIVTENSIKSYQALSKEYSAIEPPTWALLLAQAMRSVGYNVNIIDANAEKLSKEQLAKHNFVTKCPILNQRNLLFYYRLLPDNRILFGARGDLKGSKESSFKMSKWIEKRFKEIWKSENLKFSFKTLNFLFGLGILSKNISNP